MIRLPNNTDKIPVVVLAAGDYPSSAQACAALERAERVVCCDGAAAQFASAAGRQPYAIVGDCDSLDGALRERFAGILHCDPDQQTNDLTKAVRFCLDEGMNDILILGATGKREDHTVANISLLAEYSALPGVRQVRMLTDRAVLDAVAPEAYKDAAAFAGTHEKYTGVAALTGAVGMQEFTFESFPGQQVSIFTPLQNTRVTTHDLKYPLENAILRGWWGGTLNEAPGVGFSIEADGPVVVYRLLLQ